MSGNSASYKRNKERLQEKARDCYHQVGGKEKTKYVLIITEKFYKSMHKINIENYLVKKRT